MTPENEVILTISIHYLLSSLEHIYSSKLLKNNNYNCFLYSCKADSVPKEMCEIFCGGVLKGAK